MKKIIIGSLLVGLSSISLFGQQCNGIDPCDLNGTVIDDGTGSGYFVKYSSDDNETMLKNYDIFNLIGSDDEIPYSYTVARYTNSEIVLNMSKKYGTITTGFSTTGGVNCSTKWKDAYFKYILNNSLKNTLHGIAPGGDANLLQMWGSPTNPNHKTGIQFERVNCVSNLDIVENTPKVITPPTLKLSKEINQNN